MEQARRTTPLLRRWRKNTAVATAHSQIRRDWDRLRAEARTDSERCEIDAIFARHL